MAEETIVIYDTEYWTTEGAPSRNWDGLDDFPPLLIQIGAFKITLDSELTIVDQFLAYVRPKDADGKDVPINDFFTGLTNISQETVSQEGLELKDGLKKFASFVDNDVMYSYSNDMLNTIVPSCFVANIECPFLATQARDIRHIFRKTSLTDTEITSNSSGTIANYLGLEIDNHYAHDARNDAMSIILALRHLIAKNQLKPEDLV